jgi:hypothetical protein
MKAVSRFKYAYLAGALALAPTVAPAQEAPAPAQDTPPPASTVGPSALENFSLNGTITHAADQPAATQPAPKNPAPAEKPAAPAADQPASAPATTETSAASAPRTTAPAPRQTRIVSATPAPQAQPQPAPQILRQSPPSSSVTAALPTLNEAGPSTADAPAATTTDFAPAPTAPGHSFPLWPWLLAALVLGAGGAFLFWRNRSREAFAGGPAIDAFVAPEPAPAPRPAPAPPRAAPAPVPSPAPVPPPAPRAGGGLVASSLRPWIEIGFNPTRCVLDNDKVAIEFELELFNSGSQPARSVRVDVALFNASNDQDEQIGAFIANPEGAGESIDIPPLKRVGLKAQVAIARSEVKAYEMAGRRVFLPVVAFNALYGAGGGEGQTSTTYLLGRDTKNEKLGPFRIDAGPRIFRGIGARELPTVLRR